ncbi:hypothetical protein BOO91_18120 [Vibrio navarrensis]|nr:hypothetical protein [Vibrio navarrensis]
MQFALSWLGGGHGCSQGAKAYSIVETAKLNGLEPYEYLHTLLTKLPYAETVEQFESLLPWNIARY